MPNRRSYVVELESAPFPRDLTDAEIEAFAGDLLSNRRIAGPAPAVNRDSRVLELRTNVDATAAANALAIVEVAFFDAARKAKLTADVVLANVWLDQESGPR